MKTSLCAAVLLAFLSNSASALEKAKESDRFKKIDSESIDLGKITAVVVSPIFSQLVAYTLPAGFITKYETTKGPSYLREAVPATETVERWSQMITVTGARGMAAAQNFGPREFVATIAGGFKRGCADSFAFLDMGSTTISGVEAYVGVASCGTASAAVRERPGWADSIVKCSQ